MNTNNKEARLTKEEKKALVEYLVQVEKNKARLPLLTAKGRKRVLNRIYKSIESTVQSSFKKITPGHFGQVIFSNRMNYCCAFVTLPPDFPTFKEDTKKWLIGRIRLGIYYSLIEELHSVSPNWRESADSLEMVQEGNTINFYFDLPSL